MNYDELIARKLSTVPATGIAHAGVIRLHDGLFDHQAALVQWALRRGRAAIFADTGLGKSRMQLSWADIVHRETDHDVLILAPLAVAAQTVREGREIGVKVKHCRDGSDVEPGICITNYDRLHRFDAGMFGAVVLDESSCIKHHDAKTLGTLLQAFNHSPFKLCATATPAPNDWTELGTHAEFLGVCTRAEMLAEYFVHDGGETQSWRLKGHARDVFWRWVASWAALVRKPSDLGFDDSLYNLPPLNVQQHISSVDHSEVAQTGMLFALEANTLSERRTARRASMADRVRACVQTIKSEWYKLANDSQEIRDAVETGVRGSQKKARSGKPESTGEATPIRETEPRAESRSQEEVHGGLLRQESGEVQESNAGTACALQRKTARRIQEQSGGSPEDTERNKVMASEKPGEASCAESQEVRTDAGAGGDDARPAGAVLRDMRVERAEAQDVPDDRPLPCHGQGARDSLLQLQYGAGEIQGLPDQAAICDFLSSEQWVIWCDLNAEQDALEKEFGELAFSVRGSDAPEEKESRLLRWLNGERPVIISKASIMGFGINMQCARNVAFIGVTDSWEAYYQAVRRCWRFGQRRQVNVHVFSSELEGAVVANLARKESAAAEMADALSAETGAAVREEVTGSTRNTNTYQPRKVISAPTWLQTEAS